MQNQSPTSSCVEASFSAEERPFEIVTVYDGVVALARAKEMRERLETLFKHEIVIENKAWYSALFGHSQLMRQAALEAAEADMVVVSIGKAAGLPAQVKDWIESWPQRKRGGRAALVALLDREPESGMNVVANDALRDLAMTRDMDFFSNREDSRDYMEIPGIHTVHPAAPRNIVPQDFAWRGWGIND